MAQFERFGSRVINLANIDELKCVDKKCEFRQTYTTPTFFLSRPVFTCYGNDTPGNHSSLPKYYDQECYDKMRMMYDSHFKENQ